MSTPEKPTPAGATEDTHRAEHTDIGVLLPVRIETRFRPGRLLVRVVPDEPWFTRHDPLVAEGELEALARYLAVPGLAEEPIREQAWRELAGQVGGARAVYLMRAFTILRADRTRVVRPPEPEEMRTEPTLPGITGFPPELTVWMAQAGAAPTAALTLIVDRARLLADFPDLDVPGDHRWWEDWCEAVAAGLAGEIAFDGEPTDIDALYVTGLSDAEPAGLFRNHADAGRLGLVGPGTPTNSVDGEPAAPLGEDPATWWTVLQEPAGEVERETSTALTGDPNLLGNLPGAPSEHRRWNNAMVGALWPALWGFAAQDIWNLPAGRLEAAEWARHALLPEGPFPTVRIGDQPYGLLPVSALQHWTAVPNDPPVEAGMLPALLELRRAYRAAAETRGTVEGANTEQLLNLIGQVPTSPTLRHTLAWPRELWWLVLLLNGFRLSWEDFDDAWHQQHETTDTLGLRPVRRYGSAGFARRLELPLISPAELPEGQTVGEVLRTLVDIAQEAPFVYSRTEVIDQEFLGFPPDSLLLRLAIRSLQVAIGDVGRALLGEEPPGPERVVRPDTEIGRLERWIEGTEAGAVHADTPEAGRFQLAVESLQEVAELVDTDPRRAEALLLATVDTAAARIDPWLVGLPARRLQALHVDRAAARLGAYGWVDAPRPGTPGPTPAGLIHTPSPAQSLTASVLRDRAVNDAADGRWDLDLTSGSVRGADTIAEHVRVGAHLGEALGREVERIVAAPAAVARLRRDFPLRSEHAGRRVCDGLAVLTTDLGTLGLPAVAVAGLEQLRSAMDSYGDLLVAEAVNHVTEGRPDVAGAVMDAAAGLSRPPHLGLLRTPREGRAVTTSVVLMLPPAADPPEPPAELDQALLSPALLADAAAAAWLRAQTADAADWTFEFEAPDLPDSTVITLAGLGLEPADVLALPWTDVERLATEAAVDALGTETDGPVLVGGTAVRHYEAAARLTVLAGRRPAGPDALFEQADSSVDLEPLRQQVLTRYTRVRATGTLLAGLLTTELAKTDTDGLGTADGAILERLAQAVRAWGIAPDPAPETRDPQAEEPEAPEASAERRLVAVAARALELITARLAATPSTDSAAVGQPSPAAALPVDDLLDALSALVSPTGQLALTSQLSWSALPGLQPDPGLEAEWLPVVAAVRDSMARIEAHQLAAGTSVASGAALTLWSNKNGDPWQRNATDGRRMTVVCADQRLDLANLPDNGEVAAAVIDRFAEVIPAPEQTTGAVFGFDAPAARAPQAILLAVAPDPARQLGPEDLIDIITDTRLLARARMARLVDLGADLRGLLPACLLPATGATRVPLKETRR
ncbi:hypothetical protein ACFYE2_14855 [Kocuria sp. CPCC 205300]|uniref:hypothetical protein n=1 Tax=Kocuria sabuli TaxID=3071448 RepID=UPI0036DDBE22